MVRILSRLEDNYRLQVSVVVPPHTRRQVRRCVVTWLAIAALPHQIIRERTVPGPINQNTSNKQTMQLPFIASVAVLLSLAQAAAATPAGQRPFTFTAAHRSPQSSDGRYGFKRCVDKGVRPGKISCLNVTPGLVVSSSHPHPPTN